MPQFMDLLGHYANISLAWMIAAMLPLPRNPAKDMEEMNNSSSVLGNFHERELELHRQQFNPYDEARYESARWWRRLNRWMSILGVLLVSAVVSPPFPILLHNRYLTRIRSS